MLAARPLRDAALVSAVGPSLGVHAANAGAAFRVGGADNRLEIRKNIDTQDKARTKTKQE